jgi:mRNA deadenylase 3'-5' endonuclease subunit Ccr4
MGIWGRPEIDPYEMARDRKNTMVALELVKDNKAFWVSTYHMPCAFRTPLVMTMHAALVAQAIQKLAGGIPYILAGDFNLMPTSQEYKLLTGGRLDNDNPVFKLPVGDNWLPTVLDMNSVYKEANGLEPHFTNYAQSRGGPMFIECLDYIFYNEFGGNVFELKGVRKLPGRQETNGPLPNGEHPSDHLPIGATFELKTTLNDRIEEFKSKFIPVGINGK